MGIMWSCIGQKVITRPAHWALPAHNKYSVSAQQEGALEDYIEAYVMNRYNNNQRKL